MNPYPSLLQIPLKQKASRFLKKPTKPFALTMAVTYKCQSRCKICNIWKIYKKDSSLLNKELNFKDFIPLFNSLKYSLIHLTLTGGEPFLKDDLVEIASLASKKLKKLSIISVITNGISPTIILDKTKKILDKTRNINISILLSLDGNQELHDRIRGIPGNYDSALITFKSLKKLQKKYPNLQLSISYTISNHNLGKLPQSFKDIKKDFSIDVSQIGFNMQHHGLLYHKKNSLNISKKETQKKLQSDVDFIKKEGQGKPTTNLSQIGKLAFRKFYSKNLLAFANNSKKMVLPCSATSASFFIDPYGDVYPCVIWNNKLGNIKTADLNKFWSSPKVLQTRQTISYQHCPICFTPCQAQYDFLLNPSRWFRS